MKKEKIKKVIKELKELEYPKIDDIDNLVSEIEDELNFDYYCYKSEYGIISYENVNNYLLKENSQDLARCVCFLAKVDYINDDYYYLNGYGNLENLNLEDIKSFRDCVVEELETKLKEVEE